MKIILCALNAKFIHSSLAINSLLANTKEYKNNISAKEFTINHSIDFIVSELYRLKPDVLAFSCYIWNINMILDIISDIKKVMPNTKIVLGGPEVSYEYDDIFDFGIDYIVFGEGEETFKELAEYLIFGEKNINDIKGIAYKKDNQIISTGDRDMLDLDMIPFVYENGFDDYNDKIIYYETSRGCPFNCQYCLSSLEKGLRFLDINRVKKELDIFLNAGIRQVKFVDRTFNCNKKHAMTIWQHIIDNDNGKTNFHFEIAADLLDDDCLEVLKKARLGQIQFEIGVQSTNIVTLDNIKRKTNLDKLFKNVQILKGIGNINLHLDLIAGLPGEDYNSFKKSFNDVYKNYPEQFQLGFLKALKGSGLRGAADNYGIIYREKSPYEVLYTEGISFDEMLFLKEIEEMVELYYNSNKFLYSIRFMTELFGDAFRFFGDLAIYWRKNGYHLQQHNKIKTYTILFEFCKEIFYDKIDIILDLLKFDMYLCDNVKTLPYWLGQASDGDKEKIKDFFRDSDKIYDILPEYKDYSTKQINRMCAIQKFSFDIIGWIENGYGDIIQKDIFILFDYKSELNVPGVATYHSSFIRIMQE